MSIGVVIDCYLFRDGVQYRVDNYNSYKPEIGSEVDGFKLIRIEYAHPEWELALDREWVLDGVEIEVDHITTLLASNPAWGFAGEKELTIVDLADGDRLLFYIDWDGLFFGFDEREVVISTDGSEWNGECFLVDGECGIEVRPFAEPYVGWDVNVDEDGIFDLNGERVDVDRWSKSVMCNGELL